MEENADAVGDWMVDFRAGETFAGGAFAIWFFVVLFSLQWGCYRLMGEEMRPIYNGGLMGLRSGGV